MTTYNEITDTITYNCGCKVVMGTDLIYCPKHKAAPELDEYSYHLAMLVLQSDLYQRVDVKEVVDNLLATHRKVEGKEGER